MVKEIGGDFNIDFRALTRSTIGNFFGFMYHFNAIYTDSGRSAIKLLEDEFIEGEVLLPEYICDSVIDRFRPKENIRFYRINRNFSLDIEDIERKITMRTKAIYIMNYFGALNSFETLNRIREIKEKYMITIIEDTTHSIFTNPNVVGDYCICSLRKWFPIPDGGVLYAKKKIDIEMPASETSSFSVSKTYGMILKTLHLQGEYDCNVLYRSLFFNAETELDRQSCIAPISPISKFLLGYQDIDEIIKKRRKNYNILSAGLECLGIEKACNIKATDCPITLPIYIKDRDRLRYFLQENRIYCAVHWPALDISKTGSKDALRIAERILSLPIDQRYSEDDMTRIINTLKKGKGLY